jgi:hypothetical protein
MKTDDLTELQQLKQHKFIKLHIGAQRTESNILPVELGTRTSTVVSEMLPVRSRKEITISTLKPTFQPETSQVDMCEV